MTKISSARIDMENGRADNAIFKDYGETLVGGASGTNAGSAYTIDLSSGNVFFLILNSANCMFTFSNPTVEGTYCHFTVILKQDGTGGRLAQWPVNVTWSNADTVPTLSASPNSYDILNFFTVDGGALWYGGQSSSDL